MRARILVISHDTVLRTSRAKLFAFAGYSVSTGSDVVDARRLLGESDFDLVVIGRRSHGTGIAFDQTLRTEYPEVPLLRIGSFPDEWEPYLSRVVDSNPIEVLAAVEEMLMQLVIESARHKTWD